MSGHSATRLVTSARSGDSRSCTMQSDEGRSSDSTDDSRAMGGNQPMVHIVEIVRECRDHSCPDARRNITFPDPEATFESVTTEGGGFETGDITVLRINSLERFQRQITFMEKDR